MGEEFTTRRKKVTIKVKLHALELRRDISVLQRDKQRVGAKCYVIVVGSTKFNSSIPNKGICYPPQTLRVIRNARMLILKVFKSRIITPLPMDLTHLNVGE